MIWRASCARVGSIALCLLMVPATAYADDCSYTSPGDCYDQFMIALLVIAALVLLIAVGWEMLLGAAALESAAAALTAVAAEAAEAAEVTAEVTELTEVAEVTEITDLSEVTELTEIPGDAEEVTQTSDITSRLQGWLDKISPVNWFEGTKNCIPLARAVAQVIAGSDAEFFPIAVDQGSSVSALAAELGSTAECSSFAQIVSDLEAAGPGSQGIVNVSSGTYGHVFNVVNDAGTIIFMDAQQLAVATDGASVAAASGYGPASIVRFIALF